MIGILNAVISSVGSLLTFFINILPKSPFLYLSDLKIDSDLLGYINYLFPVYTMISHLQIFLTAVAVYYLYRVVLRWIKVVGD